MNFPFTCGNPHWGNDGQWVYYSSDETGNWQLWRKNISTLQKEQLTVNGGYVPKMGSNNSLYFTKFNQSGIWGKHGGEEVKVIDSLSSVDMLNWECHENGLSFLQRSIDGSFNQIMFYDFTTQNIKPLCKVNSPLPLFDKAVAISPDFNYLIFGQTINYNGDIKVLNRKKS